MAKLRSLLERGRTPVARKRTANAALSWVMWRPDRAQSVIMAGLFVVLVAVAVFVIKGSLWVQQTSYDAQMAQIRAAETSPTTGPALVPLSSAQAPTPTDMPTHTSRPVVVPTPNVEKAPQDAARAFLTAWGKAPRMSTQKAWIDALQPHTAPSLLALFESTDRSRVPAATVGLMTSVTVPELHTSHVSAQLGAGRVDLVLSDETGKWLVTDLNPGE